MELIKRQDALDALNAEVNFKIQSNIDFRKYREIVQEILNNVYEAQRKAILNLPVIEYEEISCQNCRFWDNEDFIVPGHGRCLAAGKLITVGTERCKVGKFEERTDEPDDDF